MADNVVDVEVADEIVDIVDVDVEVGDNVEKNEGHVEEENLLNQKKRKKTSAVWDYFEEIPLPDGTKKPQCNLCKVKLASKVGGPTTMLLRHVNERCPKRHNIDKKQKILSLEKGVNEMNVANFKYDHAKVREAAAYMILAHEYPFMMMEHEFFNRFMMTATPHYQKISRTTAKNDVMSVYETKKKRLKVVLNGVSRISITSDFWKSGQHIGYMCVTGHFIDSKWKLQKRILSFCDVPPPHTDMVISDAIFECLMEWGIENKVSTVTFDNASNNDAAIKYLKEILELKKKVSYAGKIFHVRCCAHIINLMVQDGLSEVKYTIENIRESVKFINASESRLLKFGEIVKQLELPHKKLILDVSTRWNSTYAMLAAALEFKDVFPRYKKRDLTYEWLPSESNWERAKEVCQFLEIFQEVTDSVSGRKYPTSNLFLPEVWKIKEVLNMRSNDENVYIQAMATKMKEKFDKYWGECILLMAIAAVLDPRFKRVLIEFCFPKFYPKSEVSNNVSLVREALNEMYEAYVTEFKLTYCEQAFSSNSERVVPSVLSATSKSKTKRRTEFDLLVRKAENIQPLRSDLDIYLEEGIFICPDTSETQFDAINWWKENSLKFRILSKMAVDVLSIPITTVASEAAFSIGGRAIDPYHASLSTKTVEALICGGDWIRACYSIKQAYLRTTEDITEIIIPEC